MRWLMGFCFGDMTGSCNGLGVAKELPELQ